jgi:hypothetical protein
MNLLSIFFKKYKVILLYTISTKVMKTTTFLSIGLLITFGNISITNALQNIVSTNVNCGNGLYCAKQQTCMSNTTGAGIVYACSPLSDAQRCMDARYSCPKSFECVKISRCFSNETSTEIDAVMNVDAFQVSKIRDFGKGMKPTAISICGSITQHFRMPNFCSCKDGNVGSEMLCSIGLQNYITIGASAWFKPCSTPSNFGYKAWVSLNGVKINVGNTWTTSFSIRQPIPGASFSLGSSNVGAVAELYGEISRFIISSRLSIGVCAEIGIGTFSTEFCNPDFISWLPVVVLQGPKYDFSRFC